LQALVEISPEVAREFFHDHLEPDTRIAP
jgi:hypothetical protein